MSPVPARLPARNPVPYRGDGAQVRPGAIRPPGTRPSVPRPPGARPGTARPGAARATAARPTAAHPGTARSGTVAPSSTARPDVLRPRLRLVDNARLEVAVRCRRARRLLVVAAVLAVGALLVLAGVNALLVSNQVRLDALEQQVVDAQARHQALRLEVATLEAPERVVSAATERLGMVAPETITYVQPAPALTAAPGEPNLPSGSAPGQAGASTTPTPPWGAVKPYLSR